MAYNTFVVAVEGLGGQLDCGLQSIPVAAEVEKAALRRTAGQGHEEFTPVVVPVGGVIAEAALDLLACGLAVEDEGTRACGFGEFRHIRAIVA
jgi:hypothetical protein